MTKAGRGERYLVFIAFSSFFFVKIFHECIQIRIFLSNIYMETQHIVYNKKTQTD